MQAQTNLYQQRRAVFKLAVFPLTQNSGLVENAGTRICGYAGMRICGYAGRRIRGYAGTSNWFNKQISKTH